MLNRMARSEDGLLARSLVGEAGLPGSKALFGLRAPCVENWSII